MATYKLLHTAEEVDHKLALLEFGTNLLPYPYYGGNTDNDVSISSNPLFTDFGDGSILVHGNISAGTSEILLDEYCVLAPGIYTIRTNTANTNFYLKAIVTTESGNEIVYDEITTGSIIDLTKQSEQAQVRTFLVIKTDTDTFIEKETIKPQISRVKEDGSVPDWKPYMSTVNNYVDNRFNGIKTKLSTDYYTQTQIDTTVSELRDQDIAILSAAQEYTDIKTLGATNSIITLDQIKEVLTNQLTLGYGDDDKVYIFLDGEKIGAGVDVSILL